MREQLESLFAEFAEAGREIQNTAKEALLLIADIFDTPPEQIAADGGAQAPAGEAETPAAAEAPASAPAEV